MLSSHYETDKEIAMQKDAVIQKICDVVIAECNAAFGDRVKSLILTGSAARGEATILHSDSGWQVLGDAEFLLTLRQMTNRTDSAFGDVVKRESSERLRSQGIIAEIDLGIVTNSYFKNLPPHIFSYELLVCGRVVSGDPNVLKLIPQITARDISREDAWRLLCNRMIEQLRFVDDLEKSPVQMTRELHYAIVKFYLDMATSYLVFAGSYAPTYLERSRRLSTLAERSGNEAPFPLRKFATKVAECTAWKLAGDEADGDFRLELWREAISYLRRLWRWEIIQLTNNHDELTIAGLANRFARQQKMEHRIRGWMSLVKRCGWLKSSSQWRRWVKLSFQSTPRYLVYQAAAEVAFRLPCLIKHAGQPPRLNVNWREIRKLLPESALQTSSRSDFTWQDLVNDILWNYSQFLQDTRA